MSPTLQPDGYKTLSFLEELELHGMVPIFISPQTLTLVTPVSAPHLSPFPWDPSMPFLTFDLGNAPAPWGTGIYGQAGASGFPPLRQTQGQMDCLEHLLLGPWWLSAGHSTPAYVAHLYRK